MRFRPQPRKAQGVSLKSRRTKSDAIFAAVALRMAALGKVYVDVSLLQQLQEQLANSAKALSY